MVRGIEVPTMRCYEMRVMRGVERVVQIFLNSLIYNILYITYI